MAKSQVATEYLVIIAVGMMILIPMIVHLNEMYVAYKDESRIASAKTTVNKIASLSNFIYSQGSPAKVVTRIYIPEGVEGIEFGSKEVSFRLRTKAGVIDVSEDTIAEIRGNLPSSPGVYNVAIIAEEGFVNLTVI